MLAGDVMTTNILTVSPDTGIAGAVALMVQHRVSGVPVIDATGALVGILTEGDLLRRVETGTGTRHRSRFLEFLLGFGRQADEYIASHGREVRDLMTQDVVSVDESAALEDVVELMEQRRVRRVPVLRDGKLVGIVSRADLMRALGEALARVPPMPEGDLDILHQVRAEIARHPWMDATRVRIAVKDGVVTLEGVIFNERARDALRVAAQTVPGVVEVKDELAWVEVNSGMFVPAA